MKAFPRGRRTPAASPPAAVPLFAFLLLTATLSAHAAPPRFDGRSAFTFLEEQVALGPRVPGSEAHAEAVRSFIDRFEKYGGRVTRQRFTALVPTSYEEGSPKVEREGVNIIARFGPDGPATYLFSAHYDTRPWADEEPDPEARRVPIPGANDGASGVAVLLELARLFAESPPPVAVEIVLFDLEDSGMPGENETYCLGSAHYARHRTEPVPTGAVNLDMIGDADLEIPKEYFGWFYAEDWVNYLYRLARDEGLAAFVDWPGDPVFDDHVNLLRAGIPACDLIDFDYPPWHTHRDLPDACSPESLQQVGELLVKLVYSQ